jgi:hypothetical protein
VAFLVRVAYYKGRASQEESKDEKKENDSARFNSLVSLSLSRGMSAEIIDCNLVEKLKIGVDLVSAKRDLRVCCEVEGSGGPEEGFSLPLLGVIPELCCIDREFNDSAGDHCPNEAVKDWQEELYLLFLHHQVDIAVEDAHKANESI